MESAERILGIIVSVIEFVSAGILLIGFIKATIGFVNIEIRKGDAQSRFGRLAEIRLQLGTYILLGLDFYIVSDIMYSMIRPELTELLNLALIVVLRTTIGYFLGKEISEIEHARTATQEEKD
jgi:uncharacterized membrane protein